MGNKVNKSFGNSHLAFGNKSMVNKAFVIMLMVWVGLLFEPTKGNFDEMSNLTQMNPRCACGNGIALV